MSGSSDRLDAVGALFAGDGTEAVDDTAGAAPSDAREQDLALRERLQRMWYPFFGRFSALTETQRAAIPVLLDGQSALLMAPTASGKTEAMLAPLLELHGRRRGEAERLAVLVVAPTRALCNDLHRRLETPARRAGVTVARRTSDAREFREDHPADVLVTTPESLDSLMCRMPRVVGEARAVVVDEVHLLAGGPRGDQVEVLLTRLEQLGQSIARAEGGACRDLQRCAASASVAAPERLAERFCGQGAAVVRAEGTGRPIHLTVQHAGDGEAVAGALLEAWQADRGRKRLLFVNRRADAESIAARLASDLPIMVHHGSVGREERLRVEQRFRTTRGAVCVATSTLEIGIDVGDVDEAWLVGPPANVASWLQRVGRANRRANEVCAIALVADAFEEARVRHLNACANEGRLHDDALPPRPAVVAQQSLSLCAQNPKHVITLDALEERLPDAARELLDRAALGELLDGLVPGDWLERGRSFWRLGPRAEDAFERGALHTAFSAPATVAVRDEVSGRVVGELERRQLGDLQRGSALVLAGRARSVRRVEDDAVIVREQGAGTARFLSREAPRISAGLAADFRDWLGIPPDVIPAEEISDRSVRLLHCSGSVRSVLLGEALRARRVRVGGLTPFTALVSRSVMRTGRVVDDPEVLLHRLLRLDEPLLETLEARLEPGQLIREVPLQIRRRWMRAAVDFHGAVAWMAGLRVE